MNSLQNKSYNPYSSVVTVMTENNLQEKLDSLLVERSKLVSKVKVLESDNLRLSQRESMCRLSRASREESTITKV